MKIVQFQENRNSRLGVIDGETLVDLTAGGDRPESIHDLYYRCGGADNGFPATLDKALENGTSSDLGDLLSGSEDDRRLLPSVTAPAGRKHLLRIWLAGVTHEDSAKLREVEAKQHTGQAINVYDQKYRECAEGGIPELFAKTDPDSCVAHAQPVSRPDTTLRLVPETELVSVYGLRTNGQVERLGFTGGNDYTDNGIEAANPLNLPQAKNWTGGCASLGPLLVTDDAFDHANVEVSCDVIRNGEKVAGKSGHTGSANLNMPDGLFHLERSLFQRVPLEPGELQVFYWGTPIVFSDADLADGLLDGDLVRMTFSGIGALENPVRDWSPPSQLENLQG